MEMGSSPDSSLSSLVICVDFLGNATKPATGDDKDATLVMLEASQRIVQDLCKSNEFQSQQIQLTHLGRRHVDEEHAVEGSINLQHNISDDRTNAASAFQQQRWAFFSIRPSRTSASTVVSTKQATHVCDKILECVQGYVTNPLFFHGITFGVSINASLAKNSCAHQKISNGDNIKIACTSGEIENLIHQFHPCDGVVPELANDENLRMKIDANNVANLHELLKEQNIGFYTGKLGLSKILAKKVMVRLEAFSSFASSQNDKNTAGKNKASVSARKSTQVSALSVYQPLLKCGGQLENNSGANCNNSITSIGRDLTRVTLFHGMFFNRWPEDLVCEVHAAPSHGGDLNTRGVFEEKVNFPSFSSFFTLLGDDGLTRKKVRAALVREACSVVDSTERRKNGNSSSLSTIVDVVGDKVANIIRQIVRDDANVRALRVQASSFVPEQGEDCRILNLNNHELEEREGGDGEGSDDDDDDDDDDGGGGPGDYQSNKKFIKLFYNALDDEYEGVKHYRGRFEHELRRKGPVASERSKPTTTRLQTEQKKRTYSEINRDVDKKLRTIQPSVNEIFTSNRTITGKARRNAFEPDEDAVKRLSGKNGEGANVCTVLDFISYGDSNPKVVRDVMSAKEEEIRETLNGAERQNEVDKSAEARSSVWRDAS